MARASASRVVHQGNEFLRKDGRLPATCLSKSTKHQHILPHSYFIRELYQRINQL